MFPRYFSYNSTTKTISTEPLKIYTFTADIKITKTETLTIYGYQKEIAEITRQIDSKFYEAILKSNLQKCVRRQEGEKAVKTALALYSFSPADCLRRIPIIMIEDALPHPSSFVKLIWWMCATSKGYRLSIEEIEELLGIVKMMCCSTIYECYRSVFGRGENIPLAGSMSEANIMPKKDLPFEQSLFITALAIRRQYRGMQCDVNMLSYHMGLWTKRFNEGDDAYQKLEEQKIEPIPLSTLTFFDKNDLLIEALDNHCCRQLVKGLPQEAPGAIWFCRSRINYRTAIQNNYQPTTENMKNLWEKIKKEFLARVQVLYDSLEF